MKNSTRIVRVLGVLIFWMATISVFAQENEPNLEKLRADTLVSKWNILSTTNESGVAISDYSTQDIFTFTRNGDTDGSFEEINTKESITHNGNWMIFGDSIKLFYELIAMNTSIDSIVYQAENNVPSVIMYRDGQEVARNSTNGLQSERYTETFLLDFTHEEGIGYPTLSSSTRSISLSHKNALINPGFSFMDIIRGLIGIAFLILVAWLFSNNRKAINWRMVGTGLGLQLILAILVLKVPFVKDVFEWIAGFFVQVLTFTQAGAQFLFDGLVADVNTFGFIFAFQILPTIVFFSAIMSILYYFGILQKVVYIFALLMKKTMGLSGAESLAAAGNIFMGQTEAPLLVKPYLENMTKSEVMALMTGGMATIAGGVFAAYIGYLGGTDPIQQQIFATHLLTASIMSAPAALVAAKIMVPETESFDQKLEVSKEKLGSNVLEAISNGTADGLRLAVNVGVMLLVFLSIIKMMNYFIADLFGDATGLNEMVAGVTDGRYSQFNLEYIFGILFSPIAWLLGVPMDDMVVVGQMLGEKTIINEFVAYGTLGKVKEAGIITHYKSVIITTYALCGFSNFASIGIQIGGIGALAPGQKKTLAALGFKALIGGTIAAFLTAAMAGMLFNLGV